MELRQLRYFVAVAEAGSVSEAARVLGVSQPAVSGRIRDLEDSVTTNLFERGARGMRLTFAGQRMLPTARRIVGEVDRIFAQADRVARVQLGTLSLGFYTSLAGGPLREALGAFRAAAPDVALELHEGSPPDLLTWLRDHDVDLVVTVLEVSGSEFQTEALWQEPLLVALPADHPLAAESALSWAQLEDQPLVLRSWARGSVLYAFMAARIAPDRYLPAEQHFVSREALLGLVGLGAGVTVMGASAACLSLPNVVYRPMVGPHASVPVTAVWMAENDNPARGRFVALLRDRRAA